MYIKELFRKLVLLTLAQVNTLTLIFLKVQKCSQLIDTIIHAKFHFAKSSTYIFDKSCSTSKQCTPFFEAFRGIFLFTSMQITTISVKCCIQFYFNYIPIYIIYQFISIFTALNLFSIIKFSLVIRFPKKQKEILVRISIVA